MIITFRNINRLYEQSPKVRVNDPSRDSFEIYYMPLAEIKDFDVSIHSKIFFDQLVKRKQELHEKIVEMSKNNDYTTENLADFFYHQNYYELIGTELSMQTIISISQQITFVGRLVEENDTTFLVSLKSS